MVLPDIFCPECGALVLDAETCSVCHWRRPVATGEIGRPAWTIALDVKLPRNGSRPVAAGNFVYFPTEAGQIVALDTGAIDTGQAVKWRYQLDSRYSCQGVTVWDEYLLFGNEYVGGFPTPKGELTVLSASSGDERWLHPLEGASGSTPTVQDGIAYFTDNTGWLYAIDLAARRELWRHKIQPPWSWAPAAPTVTPTGLLLLPGRSEQLMAFDLEKREPAWSFSVEEAWFPHSPVWVDGIVYVRCWDSHIYALDGTTGQEVWRFKAPRDFNSDLWVTGDYLYVGVKDYKEGGDDRSPAYALYTLDRRSGAKLSRYEIDGHIMARPVATTEAVFFASDDRTRVIENQGTLYGLDACGQELLWEPCVVEQRFTSDLLLVGNLVIAGTRLGAIYALPWQTVGKLESPQYYLERQEWEPAAMALALQGDYLRAAEIYEQKLGQPYQAGRLYLQAGDHRRVIDLLGSSTMEAERAVAIEAALALPEANQRGQALLALGDYQQAAQAFVEGGNYEQAGDCYLAGQALAEARDAYARAEAWDKWAKVTRELELWDELLERLLEMGDYGQAAEVYLGRGQFSQAADYFMRAGRQAEAMEAYGQLSPDQLTPEDRARIAELAEKTGQPEVAVEAYRVVEDLETAASLAESSGQYNQALELYRELGQHLKAAEMLEKLSRFGEAAEIFEQEKQEHRAAQNWERQVDLKIEQLGGIRYAKRNEEIVNWLKRAIELYEEEAEYAESEEEQEQLHTCAERGRLKLTQIQREPLMQAAFQTDSLVVGQGSVVRCVVENVGWGTAREPVLFITSRELEHELDAVPLESLKRNDTVEREFTVVPTVGGALTLKVKFQGQSRDGEPLEFKVDGSPYVVLEAQAGAPLVTSPAKSAVDANWGSIWEESRGGSTGSSATEAISAEDLVQQKIQSLRRRLVLHNTNLNKLLEQAAQHGAGNEPIYLLNQTEQEKQYIEDIEAELRELEAQE